MAESASDVLVQPVSSYQEGDGLKHSHDAPYLVSRSRAAALKANGLVELVEGGVPPGTGKPKLRGRRSS